MANSKSRLAGLTEEELLKYRGLMGYASVHSAMDASIVTEFAESLAACRASEARKKKLLKKMEWIMLDPNAEIWKCLSCGRLVSNEMMQQYQGDKKDLHYPDCALAAELEGTEGGE